MRDATTNAILERLTRGVLSERILDNTVRGLCCEFMGAEALGESWKTVGLGWDAWDRKFGPAGAEFPERIRIQVRNTARLQLWTTDDKVSNSKFELKYRRQPWYFERDFSGIPCEDEGFLCGLLVLCCHPENSPDKAEQFDTGQWRFYLLPLSDNGSRYVAGDLADCLSERGMDNVRGAPYHPMTGERSVPRHHSQDILRRNWKRGF